MCIRDRDDAGDEHTYTADQYRALLRQRGLEKLAEYQKIETVNGDVDPNANLTYGCLLYTSRCV